MLLPTGSVQIAIVMRRLLSGYAMTYNRRHRRWGHLFQNRYKSICARRSHTFWNWSGTSTWTRWGPQ